MVIALGARVKVPGEAMIGEDVELIARHQAGDEMPPYERLLGDAMRGDASLFAREDSVEAAWRVVDPVLGNVTPVYRYKPNTGAHPKPMRSSPDRDAGTIRVSRPHSHDTAARRRLSARYVLAGRIQRP